MGTDGLSLGVLCLSGCLILSTCVLHKYHFVNIDLTWNEAQTYCRTNYTDLATIENTAEVNKLISTVSSAGYSSDVWIGIYVALLGNWTHYYASEYLYWTTQSESDIFVQGFWCTSADWVTMYFENFTTEHPFICDDGNQKVFVNVSMDCLSAWKYCKQNHTDLTSQYSSSFTVWNNEVIALIPSGAQVWVGFIVFNNYSWSDSSIVSFKYWDPMPLSYNFPSELYGAADVQTSGKWSFLPNQLLPFVCNMEDIEVDTIKVVRVRVSSSTDVNDSALEANILAQLQKIFMEKGLSEAALAWKKQPDGKIFLRADDSELDHGKQSCCSQCD